MQLGEQLGLSDIGAKSPSSRSDKITLRQGSWQIYSLGAGAQPRPQTPTPTDRL
jgi:hypothetical protein